MTPQALYDAYVVCKRAIESGANVVTTEYSDWATNCPEYKVTAVEITPATHRSQWQDRFAERSADQERLAEAALSE